MPSTASSAFQHASETPMVLKSSVAHAGAAWQKDTEMVLPEPLTNKPGLVSLPVPVPAPEPFALPGPEPEPFVLPVSEPPEGPDGRPEPLNIPPPLESPELAGSSCASSLPKR